jgi:nucleoside-diphosphate-sugar epimerase
MMGDQTVSNILKVEQDGIYHALPTFPADLKGLSAIVFGANGISGHHMLRVLSRHPERWSTIYSVSRRAQSYSYQVGNHVKHVAADLLENPEKVAEKMKLEGVKADYVFFFAYLQPAPPEGAPLWSNVEEMCEVNAKLLQNSIDALVLAGIKPKRFLLQTGTKHYGIHMGPAINPIEESDPRVELEKNFYYIQEDILWAASKKNGFEWNVTRPSFIWGAVPAAAMNIAYPLGLYASIQKHLGRSLDFPGDIAAWEKILEQSSAQMNCYLAEWAVLTSAAKNEILNAGDGGPFSWARFWPKLAAWYGLKTRPPDEYAKYNEFTVPYETNPRG